MALNRTPAEALESIKRYLDQQPIDRVWEQIAQDSSDRIWNAAPWRWTIGEVTPVTITAGAEQDFTITVPGDFDRFEKCFIQQARGWRPITPVSYLPDNLDLVGAPTLCSYVAGTDPAPNKVRFDVTLLAYPDATKFLAWYKKSAPLIVEVMQTPGGLAMPDSHYNVFFENCLYYAYRFCNDQRAGGAQINVNAQGDRSVIYTGQLGVAMAALEELRQSELLLWRWPTVEGDLKKER